MNSKQLKKIKESLPYNCSTPKNYIKWVTLLMRLRRGINYGSKLLNLLGKNIITQEHKGKFKEEEYSAATVALPLSYRVPPICVHENILESLVQTNVKGMETPAPSLPAYIFLLPLNANDFFKSFKNISSTQINIDAIFVHAPENSDWFPVVFTTKERIYFRYYFWSKAGDFNNLINPCFETELLLERLVKNLILIYTYETKQITEEHVKVTTKGKSFTKDKEVDDENKPSLIRWLGKTFVRQQTKYINATNKSKESNRTVASHWRRGHWHTVCYGLKRKQRKQQWFKPVLVNTCTE
jgi:hypothetical protein